MNTSQNSAHSFTEGSDINTISLNDQITVIDGLLKSNYMTGHPNYFITLKAIKEKLLSDISEVEYEDPTETERYKKLQLQSEQIYDLYKKMGDCPLKAHLEQWFEVKKPAHYAPLRAGKNIDTIVTDVSTHEKNNTIDMEREIGYYGGFLIAESIPSERLRDQLIEAYNDYYLPKASGISKATVNKALSQNDDLFNDLSSLNSPK